MASGSYSVAADLIDWTNTDDVMEASFVLQGAFSVATAANKSVYLYAQLKAVDGTNDAPIPTDNYGQIYLGAVGVKDGTTATQYAPLTDVMIPATRSGQAIKFYIKNGAGQSLSAGWKLLITPKGVGAKA